jgi:hypothetical protein
MNNKILGIIERNVKVGAEKSKSKKVGIDWRDESASMPVRC